MFEERAKPNTAIRYDETTVRDHLLAAIRVSSIRLLLTKLELDSIGTALKGGARRLPSCRLAAHQARRPATT